MADVLELLGRQLGELLLARQWRIGVAESCTGGWLAQVITSVAGSSQWFDRGFVTYSNEAKQQMLAVSEQTLASFGAVSENTVLEMARGVLQYSLADVSVAISGVAGPDGGTDENPVGSVWFAWGSKHFDAVAEKQLFEGNRQQVREQSVQFALVKLITLCNNAFSN